MCTNFFFFFITIITVFFSSILKRYTFLCWSWIRQSTDVLLLFSGMRWYIITLIHLRLVCSQLNTDDSNEFWLEARLVEINWKLNCLTTGGCAEPRFRLIKTNMVTNEKISISWSITDKLVEVNKKKKNFINFFCSIFLKLSQTVSNVVMSNATKKKKT